MSTPAEDLGISSYVGEGGLLELAAEVTKQFGGMTGVVEKWRKAYDDPKTLPSVKNQIIIALTNIITKANAIRSGTDYTKMTTDELRAAALKLIGDHQGTLPWMANGQA